MRVESESLQPDEAYTVFIDGQDVSDRCFIADDELGEVHLWKPDPQPDMWPDADHPALGPETEVLHGKVEIRRRSLKKIRRSITEWVWTSQP